MIPSPLKMLVSGTLAEKLAAELPLLLGPGAEFRATGSAVSQDLEWANSFTGFDLAPELDTRHLEWVHCWGAGVEQWLGSRLAPACLLTRTVGQMPYKIAEFCLAHSLSMARDLFGTRAKQLRHTWEPGHGSSLKNMEVAVLGAGAIGAEICRLYRSIGVTVTNYGRTGSMATARVADFPAQAAHFDILIVCLPITPATRDLVNADLLDRCRLQQFINVGRGETVNTDDLLAALSAGRIGQAVLDVFPNEPLPADSPLWDKNNLYVSPHCSAPTETSDIVDSLRELLADGPESRLVVDRNRSY